MALAATLDLTAEKALQRLIEGNQRFIQGAAHFSTVCKETLAVLAKGQRPFATVLGCSDSRVPPELIFDADFGELFVVRIAGNVVSPEVIGSLQYAGEYLHTPLFVVLGHEGCGAVKAALETKLDRNKDYSRVQVLVNDIVPGLSDLKPTLSEEELLTNAVEANVRWSISQMERAANENAINAKARFVGAVYEIISGHVRWLP